VVERQDLARSFPSSVDRVLAQRDFYAIETDTGRSQEVENSLLSTIETEGGQAIDRVVNGAFPPSREDRGHISVFIAAQWLRGWDMREVITESYVHSLQMGAMNQTRESVRQFFRKTEHREPAEDEVTDVLAFANDPTNYRIELHPNVLVGRMLELLPVMARLASARTWQLLRTTDPLVTSDAPVSLWTAPENEHPFYGSSGFWASDELAFPVDRRCALVLSHKAPAGEIVRDVDSTCARVLNRRTASSGRRYIVHHPDDDPLRDMQLPPSSPKLSVSPSPRRVVPEGK
jgi:hypothetical protein